MSASGPSGPLVLSADYLCKQFGPRSGPIECLSIPGSKAFDTLIVFLKEFYEKIILNKVSRRLFKE